MLQGIKGMLSDTNMTDSSINKTTVVPTIDPAMNKTTPPFLNKTDIAMMLPAVNKTITADPAMNKTGIFNKTMMEPADPVINRTQLMPTITLPSKAAIKANITAALDPMTAINTTIATAAGFRPSGGGSTGDNAVGFGNVDAGGFNAVPGVQCATGLNAVQRRAHLRQPAERHRLLRLLHHLLRFLHPGEARISPMPHASCARQLQAPLLLRRKLAYN